MFVVIVFIIIIIVISLAVQTMQFKVKTTWIEK